MALQATGKLTLVSRLPFFGSRSSARKDAEGASESSAIEEENPQKAPKWSFGVLNDTKTVEVPGSVLLLADDRNKPLGMRNAPARTSHSSMPTGVIQEKSSPYVESDQTKKTGDGKIILEPQPEDSANDPLNWAAWRRDSALISLGIFCMIGGGLTPILAAGFTNVAEDYGVPVSQVSLTTGLYMMGLGIGSVIASPTAILYGKRPVYLFSTILLMATSAWCALSPSFVSLILARIFQGIAVSPVECLPSATIAEIFFLHERAFRIGIYTLLLLGGKNLVPLVSAAIIQRLGWRWVFWVVLFVVAFCAALLFVFVPETFWERAPKPKARSASRPSLFRRMSSKYGMARVETPATPEAEGTLSLDPNDHQRHRDVHFSSGSETETIASADVLPGGDHHVLFAPVTEVIDDHTLGTPEAKLYRLKNERLAVSSLQSKGPEDGRPAPTLLAPSSLHGAEPSRGASPGAFPGPASTEDDVPNASQTKPAKKSFFPCGRRDTDSEKQSVVKPDPKQSTYSHEWREREAKSFVQQLKPWHGRLNQDKWLKVAVRPLILFAYPSVLWSAAVYACSVGWLIVISESVAVIYREGIYHFTALQTGLVYISPFIGGVLGTAVAGKVSDVIVKAMARRNGGLYEPEFRLVMAAPVAVTTVIGLMGYGWSAQAGDNWIVPTVFLGVVSFGCSLGSTTSITFCVDSYRQYAGEALVTLNFSKNIFHGLVFSLFVTGWIATDGPKAVFIWIGVIQLIVLFFTIPMFIYGKRARMWTVRKNFMEKF